MHIDPILHACPRLPRDVRNLKRRLIREFGERAEADLWRYVSWYESRFGIDDLERVWIKAINRTFEKYQAHNHKTGAVARKFFG
jgi:peptidoglycan/xylan/chitin deacetylase (PgdA/CDA1 family)